MKTDKQEAYDRLAKEMELEQVPMPMTQEYVDGLVTQIKLALLARQRS